MASTKLSTIAGGGNDLPQLTRARDINIDAEVGDRVFYDPVTKKVTTEYQGMSDIFKIDYVSSGFHPNSAVAYSDEPISVKTSDGLYHVFVLASATNVAGTSHYLQAFTCVKGDGHILKNTASTSFTTTSSVVGNLALGKPARVGVTDDYIFLAGEAFIDTGPSAANFVRATWNDVTEVWTFTRHATAVTNNTVSLSLGIIDVVYHATSGSVFAFIPDSTGVDPKFYRYVLSGDTVSSGTVSAGTPRRGATAIKDIGKYSGVSMMAHVLSDDKFIIFGQLALGGVYSWSGSAFNLDQANPITINQSGAAYTVLIDGDPDAFIRMEESTNMGAVDWRVFRYSGGTLTETSTQTNTDALADGRNTTLNVNTCFRWVGNNTIQNFNGYASGQVIVVNLVINDDDSFTEDSGTYFTFHSDTDYKFNFHQDEDGITHSYSFYVGNNSTDIGYMAVVRGSAGAFLDDYRPIPMGYISAIDGTDYTYDIDSNYNKSTGLTAGDRYGNAFALDESTVLIQKPIVANYKRLNRIFLVDNSTYFGNRYATDDNTDAFGDQRTDVLALGCYALKAPDNSVSAMVYPAPKSGTNGNVYLSITCDGLVFYTAAAGSPATTSGGVECMVSQSSIKTQAVQQVQAQPMFMCLTVR